MGFIIYNGRSSREVGLEVETYPSYSSPQRSYTKVNVPGRNGDIIIDNGSWENAKRVYSVSVGSRHRDYTEMVREVSEWLHSSLTYTRLEDSYEPEYYRLAVFLEEVEFSNIYNQGAQAELTFDCKPQRFLKIGELPVIIQSPTKTKEIYNPTSYSSLPLIKVYGTGSGQLVVGTQTVVISNVNTEIDIDCELQDAYSKTVNMNSVITLKPETSFPTLAPGSTTIGFSGGITKVEVIPRWYEI